MRYELLRLDHVSKFQNDSTILRNVNLTVYRGEIMGLMHISSLGLPQLIELICHNRPIDFGNIYFDGHLVNTYRYNDNSKNPVFVVDETCRLCAGVSIAENFYQMGAKPHPRLYHRRTLAARAEKLLSEFDLPLSADSTSDALTPGERSIVEMLCAYIHGQNLIILWEPESYLSETELDTLFDYVRRLSARGMSFLYVGIHAEKLFSVCERLALMDRGSIVKIFTKAEMNDAQLAPFLSPPPAPAHAAHPTQTLLQFRNVRSPHLKSVSFQVQKGSCAVLVDRLGNASDDIMRIMSLSRPAAAGEIFLDGVPYRGHCARRLRGSVAFIPSHPLQEQLFPDMSYMDNLCMLLDLKRRAHLKRSCIERSILREYGGRIGADIHARDLHALSTGALYDLVYYRVLLMHPKLVFIDRPFAGCDWMLRRRIQSLIQTLQADGITVVLLTMTAADTVSLADTVYDLPSCAAQ